MKRREYLKRSSTLLGGALVAACSSGSGDGREGSSSAAPHNSDSRLFGRGEVAISESGWTAPRGLQPGYASLRETLRADVVVVGAGLAGSSLALHLAERGVNVVVLEARQPAWGASGRNAGHVLPVMRDLDKFKQLPGDGQPLIELFRQHHTIPFDLARRHGIDCDAVQSGYLNATTYQGTFDRLKHEAAYWRNEHHQPVEALGKEEMRAATGSDYYPYGVLYQKGGRINPYLFTHGMVAAAVRHSARVYGDSEAQTLERTAHGWEITTAEGSVLADRVVFCTNAYPTKIVPAFTGNYYPLTAYGVSTQPLSDEALQVIMPSRATLAQEPFDLNPFLIDGSGRIIMSSLPSSARPQDSQWHFEQHLAWILRTWPEARDFDIAMDDYWTGRVALRDQGYPGVFELQAGLYGLMHFNAWGNVMAPLMGMLFAQAMASGDLSQLAIPLSDPRPVDNPGKQEFIIRRVLVPAARLAQKLGVI